MNSKRSAALLASCLALLLPSCGSGAGEPMEPQKGIEEAAKAAEKGKEYRKLKPAPEAKRKGEDARFPGSD